jgi:hypothetical protein
LAVIRVRLRPLVPRAPIVAGASVSFFGETVVDGRFDVKVPFLPRIDLLCLPPLRFAKFFLLGPTLRKRMTYPAAIHVPVLDFEHPAVKQLTSTTSAARAERHALEISVLSARNLDAADAFGTSDPFVVVALAGEGRYDERFRKTSTKKRTLHPKWFERFTYVVAGSETSARRSVRRLRQRREKRHGALGGAGEGASEDRAGETAAPESAGGFRAVPLPRDAHPLGEIEEETNRKRKRKSGAATGTDENTEKRAVRFARRGRE